MLTARIRKILLTLLDKSASVSAKELADSLHVSLRSVRYDLKELCDLQDELGFDLVSVPGKGISLKTADPEGLRESIACLSPYRAPLSPEERRLRLEISLLLSEGKTVEAFADVFQVSNGTVYRDLKAIEDGLSDGLSLHRENNILEIAGPEVIKRETLVELLVGRSENVDEVGWHWFAQLSSGDSSAVKSSLEYVQTALGYKFADSSYLALFIHLLIALQRVRSGHQISIDQQMHKTIVIQPEYRVACEIARIIFKSTGNQLPEAEQCHIALHLLGSKIRERPGAGRDDDGLNRTTLTFVETFEAIHGVAGLSSDTRLLNDLAMHLRPALKRASYQLSVKNPLLTRVQTEFSDVYQSARRSCQQLDETKTLDEDELSFLVMHLAAALERLKRPHTIKAVVICSTGLGSARLLSERISRRFPNIEVIAVASAVERDFPAEAELAISTVPVRLQIPVVQVSPLLVEDEIARLEKAVYGKSSLVNEHVALDSVLGAIMRNCIVIDEGQLLSDLQLCFGINAPLSIREGLSGLTDTIHELEHACDVRLSPETVNGLSIHFTYTASRLRQGNFWQEPELAKEMNNPRWKEVKQILQRRFSEWKLPWSDHEVPPILRYFETME